MAVESLDGHNEVWRDLEMGMVELWVRDIEKVARFYEALVGLEILEETKKEVVLGFGTRSVVKLVERKDLMPAMRGSAGLYHLAIVFESRAGVAQAVERILQTAPDFFTGTADHLVSEAFYFNDPEGNGVELYFDKDPRTWEWKDGRVVMGAVYIDPVRYIATFGSRIGGLGRKLGHVHLKVGNIVEARKFYVDLLGLKITAEMGTALFVSDGTYHHHVGMNVWDSSGAGKRGETLGLGKWEVVVSGEGVRILKGRLGEAKYEFEEVERGIEIDDWWGNRVMVGSKG